MFDFMKRYSFHDTAVNNIEESQDCLYFYFLNGVYSFDSNDRDFKKTCKCKLKMYIKNFAPSKPYEHIEIKKTFHSKVSEIDFDIFKKMLAKNDFKIWLDYYSYWFGTLVFKGTINKFQIEITVTDIEKLEILSYE